MHHNQPTHLLLLLLSLVEVDVLPFCAAIGLMESFDSSPCARLLTCKIIQISSRMHWL